MPIRIRCHARPPDNPQLPDMQSVSRFRLQTPGQPMRIGLINIGADAPRRANGAASSQPPLGI
jgi:hypothetical protein